MKLPLMFCLLLKKNKIEYNNHISFNICYVCQSSKKKIHQKESAHVLIYLFNKVNFFTVKLIYFGCFLSSDTHTYTHINPSKKKFTQKSLILFRSLLLWYDFFFIPLISSYSKIQNKNWHENKNESNESKQKQNTTSVSNSNIERRNNKKRPNKTHSNNKHS